MIVDTGAARGCAGLRAARVAMARVEVALAAGTLRWRGESYMRKSHWRRRGAAVLIGGLVGPYTVVLGGKLADVAISAVALGGAVVLGVLLDRTLERKPAALLRVIPPMLILGGLAIAAAADTALWQGYAADAAWICLIGLMLLTPLGATFALGVRGEAADGSSAPAVMFATLAWVGVGMRNVVLPYLLVLVRAVFIVSSSQELTSYRMLFGLSLYTDLMILTFFVYVCAFGVALPLGLLGATLRTRLTRTFARRAAPRP